MSQWTQHAGPGYVVDFRIERYGSYLTYAFKKLTKQTAPPCGTVGCIAGWVCITQGIQRGSGYEASKVLDFDTDKLNKLFHVEAWPNRDLAAAYVKARTAKRRVAVVCQAIDEFIEQYSV